ncbi:AraC family transcriptional regulator [Methylobacterium sp. J-067]|uniref:AraC family transcriptional regulator n=1 Tax=Methylobacterium sp. J-067 TaxID=2836648 RepID=UPI001FBB8844|nr:AraC family transcriptional regulator [Methylobacterium sp. J-067]MCJ2024496.1 AraC family transcriptional regulator [Methylobacterium sp. J-067]
MLERREYRRDRPDLMDPLSDILTLLRPTGYGFRGLDTAGDWALDFREAHGIRCFAIEAGSCWLQPSDDDTPTLLSTGDVALVMGGQPVRLYSRADAEPRDAFALFSSAPAGGVASLNGGGECRGVGGFFELGGSNVRALLAAVPPVVHVRSDNGRDALLAGVRRLMRELSEPLPGGALLASHFAQALLVEALRAHLADGEAHGGWLAALAHPTMRRALAAMHGDVARRWTLHDLAQVSGMSRSSFAAQFESVTGETPIAYLTRWRMALAADRLANTATSLAQVAASVGYNSVSAFGAAFKRITGRSPRRRGEACV